MVKYTLWQLLGLHTALCDHSCILLRKAPPSAMYRPDNAAISSISWSAGNAGIELAIDETSRARGHDSITLAADAVERRVLAVAEGRSVETVKTLAGELKERGGAPEQVSSVSIDMSPAFIKRCIAQFPNARITFDKFHVVWHASTCVDKMRRIEHD